MTRPTFAGTALALATLAAITLTTGCASHRHDPSHMIERLHLRPQVTVKAGIVSISPEPLVFARDERDVRITWQAEKGFSFTDDGIVIEGRVSNARKGQAVAAMTERLQLDRDQKEIIDCQPAADRRSFSCRNLNTRSGVFKYTIRVRDAQGRVHEFDPTIMNND